MKQNFSRTQWYINSAARRIWGNILLMLKVQRAASAQLILACFLWLAWPNLKLLKLSLQNQTISLLHHLKSSPLALVLVFICEKRTTRVLADSSEPAYRQPPIWNSIAYKVWNVRKPSPRCQGITGFYSTGLSSRNRLWCRYISFPNTSTFGEAILCKVSLTSFNSML